MTIIPYPVTPNTIYNWDASTLARTMRGCGFRVNCVVTSPPYYGLRDYCVDGQIGLEPTPDEYVAALVGVFREIREVMMDDATLWLNLGDTYTGGGRGGNPPLSRYWKQGTNRGNLIASRTDVDGIPPKSMLGIPWRVAFALQADGWYLRSDIIWAKGNPMPESVTDRPTKAHEYVFLLAKSASYYYDAAAIADPIAETTLPRMLRGVSETHENVNGAPGQTPHSMNQPRVNVKKQDGTGNRRYTGFNDRYFGQPELAQTRNKRTVWNVNTAPFSGAHFATFPPKLIEPMILAGCPETVCAVCGKPHVRVVNRIAYEDAYNAIEGHRQQMRMKGVMTGGTQRVTLGKTDKVSRDDLGFAPTCTCNGDTRPGVVFDPFMGAGTTALVSRQHRRDYVGSEINPQYVAIAQERLRLPFEQHYVEKPKAELSDLPLFAGMGDAS